MKYVVDDGMFYAEFNTYREAEIFVGVYGLHGEDIYEMEANENE